MPDNAHIKRLLDQIALQDSKAAYKELFLLLYKQLCQFAYGILKSHNDAEEVVSDTFAFVWEKREKLTNIESPLSYLYTSIKNRSLNRIERQKRQRALDTGEWIVPLNSVYFDPEKLLMTEELIQKIRKAIEELPVRCQLIFKLVKEDGLKYKEVADLLQISVKTVETQMAIAIRRLGKCMYLDITAHQGQKTPKK
ncbi:RNA polymerase sigma-70 factor [Pseudoflavitalea sp. X16]|uniref:RNA polymerase sigma-70 factor n=1 Tax=Paraflavitalea devenefica TaxID=2716334 RepID=UPI00141F2156|nr:RNA polymerase sigma-70 factor [Paraflavitalea devenefica]NII28023.1 RNA polymerase sigma-70 factor [Paraflavitalea devenefica]